MPNMDNIHTNCLMKWNYQIASSRKKPLGEVFYHYEIRGNRQLDA